DQVRPFDTDFAKDKEGRVLISSMYDTGYDTTERSTADDKPAQTQDGQLTITAWLGAPVAGVDVYFEVLDPDDPARYSNKTKMFDSDKEDADAKTVYDFSVKPNHGIENPVSDDRPNDNRDPTKNMVDNSLTG